MHVHGADLRHVQVLLGQDLPESRGHAEVGLQRRQVLRAVFADALGLEDRRAVGNGQLLDGAEFHLVAASLGPVGLAEHAGHLVARVIERLQGRYGEVRCAHKDDAHQSCSSCSCSSSVIS